MQPVDQHHHGILQQLLTLVLSVVISGMLLLMLRDVDPPTRRAVVFSVLGVAAFVVWGMVLRRTSQWIDEWRGD